jgi:hypothetical protein
MLVVGAILRGGSEAAGRLAAALDGELAAALRRGLALVAAQARAAHTFQNRTGRLEGSILPGDVTGSALDGDLRGTVVAATPYASYVEEGTSRALAYPYLAPAFEATEAALSEALSQGMARAVERVL